MTNYKEKLSMAMELLAQCDSYLPEDTQEVNKKINDINLIGEMVVEAGVDIQKETGDNPLKIEQYTQAARLFNSKRLSLLKAVNKRKKEMQRKWLKDALESGKVVVEGVDKEAVQNYLAKEEFKAHAQEANKSPERMLKESMQHLNYAIKKAQK